MECCGNEDEISSTAASRSNQHPEGLLGTGKRKTDTAWHTEMPQMGNSKRNLCNATMSLTAFAVWGTLPFLSEKPQTQLCNSNNLVLETASPFAYVECLAGREGGGYLHFKYITAKTQQPSSRKRQPREKCNAHFKPSHKNQARGNAEEESRRSGEAGAKIFPAFSSCLLSPLLSKMHVSSTAAAKWSNPDGPAHAPMQMPPNNGIDPEGISPARCRGDSL